MAENVARPDISQAPVTLIAEPWDAGRLRGELVRSHPHEVVTVRTDDGLREYVVTGCRRWHRPGAPTVTTLTVGDELVPLVPAEVTP